MYFEECWSNGSTNIQTSNPKMLKKKLLRGEGKDTD